MAYTKIEQYDEDITQQLAANYKNILNLIEEDTSREGLEKTPERVAKSMQFLTQGYQVDPAAILNSAKFKEEYQQIVLVKDIELYSLCETLFANIICSRFTVRHMLHIFLTDTLRG